MDSFFNGAYAAATAASTTYKNLEQTAGNGILVYDIDYNFNTTSRTLTLRPTATNQELVDIDLIVYNITSDGSGKFTDINLIIPDAYDGKIIVNFLGLSAGTDYEFMYGTTGSLGVAQTRINGIGSYAAAMNYSHRIVFNFPDGGNINTRHYRFLGSVLAPNSNFTAGANYPGGGSGNVNGTLIAQTIDVFASENCQAHNTAAGFAPPKPGASTYSLSLEIGADYTPSSFTPVTAVIDAKKELDGRPLKAGEFEFELYKQKGYPLYTVKNGADGKITFPAIEYTVPGEYIHA